MTLKNIDIAVPAKTDQLNPIGETGDAQPNTHAIPSDTPNQIVPVANPITKYLKKCLKVSPIVPNARRSRNRTINHVANNIVNKLKLSLYNRIPIGGSCVHLLSVELNGTTNGTIKIRHTRKNKTDLHNIFHIVEIPEFILDLINCYFNRTSFFTCLKAVPAEVL